MLDPDDFYKGPPQPTQAEKNAIADEIRRLGRHVWKLDPKRCPKCHKLTEGGHERDGTDWCWCVEEDD